MKCRRWDDWEKGLPTSRIAAAHPLLRELSANPHYRLLRAKGWGDPNHKFMVSLWPCTLLAVGPVWWGVPRVLGQDGCAVWNLGAALLFFVSYIYLSRLPYQSSGMRKMLLPSGERMADYHLAGITPQMLLGAVWGIGLSPIRIRALKLLSIMGLIGGIAPAYDHSEYASFSRWFVLTISCVSLGTAPSLPWPMLYSVQSRVREAYERRQMKERPLLFGKELLFRILIFPLIMIGIGLGITVFFVLADWLDIGGPDYFTSHSQPFYMASYLIYASMALFTGLVLGNACFTFSGMFLGNSHDRIVEIFRWGGVETLTPLSPQETDRITYSPSRGKHYWK